MQRRGSKTLFRFRFGRWSSQQSVLSIWRTGNRIKVKPTHGLEGHWRNLCSVKGRNLNKVPQILSVRTGIVTQACLIIELVLFLCNVPPLGGHWLMDSSAQQTSFLYQCLQHLAIWPWYRSEMCMVRDGRLAR